MADGIDVFTLYQDVTDWQAVRRAGYSFAYVKVSDGDEYRSDGGYGPAGRAAGLAMGGYHYAEPGNPVAQADLLVARVEAAGLTDLAPALDLEDPFLPDQHAVDFAIAFLRRVLERGHRPCLYGNQTMLSTVRAPVLAAVPETLVWAARYSTSPPTVPHDVWQWSSSGHIPGISASSVDLNRASSIPFNVHEEDDMFDDNDKNRLHWLEQGVRTLINQATGNGKGDPIFDANMNAVSVDDWGWPSLVDPSKRFSVADLVRLIDLHTCEDSDVDQQILTLVKGISTGNVDVDALAAALQSTLAPEIVKVLGQKLTA